MGTLLCYDDVSGGKLNFARFRFALRDATMPGHAAGIHEGVASLTEEVEVEATQPDGGAPTVPELAEQAGLAIGVVALQAGRLAAARRAPEVRHAAVDGVVLAGLALAAVTAFALANWAAVEGLQTELSGWRAPLVLAAAWLGLALLCSAVFLGRRQRLARLRHALALDPAEALAERRDALGQAEEKLRGKLVELTEAVAHAAEERIAAAILPLAGGMVHVGEEMVEATDDVIEAADEITDALEERVPGGAVVNRAFEIALAPGRMGVRVVKSVLETQR
jgi:hypothetical protein